MQEVSTSSDLPTVEGAAEVNVHPSGNELPLNVLRVAPCLIDRLNLRIWRAGRAADQQERLLFFKHLFRLHTLSSVIKVVWHAILIVHRQI